MARELAARPRYDGVTITLHWLTAFLVIALFATAMGWTPTPRDWGLRWLSGLHVSLGVLLAIVVGTRLVWRTTAGRRLGHEGENRTTRILAKVVHLALYGLLAVQIGLGFGLEWLGGGSLSFFGLFDIPAPFAENRDLGRQLEAVHGRIAWIIMAVVGGHAAAALWHHYVVKDGILARMLPKRKLPDQVTTSSSSF